MEVKGTAKIGDIIRQKRVSIPLTICELGENSGVSQSHIGRIERGERLPSIHVLRKIAKPLGFKEEELFMLAGFLSIPLSNQNNIVSNYYHKLEIDPFVANILAHEPVEVQRGVIGILNFLKIIAQTNK